MARNVRPELLHADRAAARYYRQIEHEARRLGYPAEAPIWRYMRVGYRELPCVLAIRLDDNEAEIVGQFLHGLKDIDRSVFSARYLRTGTEVERARRFSMSVGHMRVTLDRLLCRLDERLKVTTALAA